MASNQRVREAANESGVKLWQVADALGITDSTFSRKLRHELTQAEQERILRIIREVRNGQTCA